MLLKVSRFNQLQTEKKTSRSILEAWSRSRKKETFKCILGSLAGEGFHLFTV